MVKTKFNLGDIVYTWSYRDEKPSLQKCIIVQIYADWATIGCDADTIEEIQNKLVQISYAVSDIQAFANGGFHASNANNCDVFREDEVYRSKEELLEMLRQTL